MRYRIRGADFVLLDVADPARCYLEGWIDGSAKSKCRIPQATHNEEVKSKRILRVKRLHCLHSSVSPDFGSQFKTLQVEREPEP